MTSLPRKPLSTSRPVRAAAAAAVSLICIYAGIQDRDRDVDIIAAQIRRLGFICKDPGAAELIESGTPHQKTYLLRCEGIDYRVRLIPNRAAKVTEVH